MTMKKKILTTLSVVLILGLAALGILAYLQSEDSDVNVMTLGNVSIEQHEYERVVENGEYKTDTIDGVTSYVLKDFTQAKPLLPATEVDANGNPYNYGAGDYANTRVKMSQVDSHGSMDVFVNKNPQDKFVTVENTGKSDAYVRTLIAYELGSVKNFNDVIMTSCFMTAQGVWKVTDIGAVEIDGNKYFVSEYIYNGAKALGGVHENGVLPAGDTTYPSLAQVYMKATATNEDCEAIDGNKNGTYDILVLSQAVQVEGFDSATAAFDAAFPKGTDNANVAGWFEGMKGPGVLYDVEDINESTQKNGTFVLSNNIETSGNAAVTSEVRYGYGYEYIVRKGVDYTLNLNGKTIEHKAVNKNDNNNALTYLFVANNAGTKLTIDGNGKVYCNNSEGYTCAVQGKDGTLVTINGGDFEVDNGIAVWAGAGAHIVINDGSFVNGNAKTDHELIYSSGGVIDIYGGFFHNTDGNYTLNVEDRNRATGFINVYGGTYVNFDPSTGGQDPNNIKVADGYKVVSETQSNGDVWYTVVPE